MKNVRDLSTSTRDDMKCMAWDRFLTFEEKEEAFYLAWKDSERKMWLMIYQIRKVRLVGCGLHQFYFAFYCCLHVGKMVDYYRAWLALLYQSLSSTRKISSELEESGLTAGEKFFLISCFPSLTLFPQKVICRVLPIPFSASAREHEVREGKQSFPISSQILIFPG
jgi:hypothetical protein